MKYSSYLHPKRLEFLVTYRCTGQCRHCSVGDRIASPGKIRAIDPEIAVEAVRSLSKIGALSSVMTFGGEPLLFPDTVCTIHRTATKCGISTRQVITNGFFSRDPATIQAVAYALVESGVNDLLLSVDSFHQRTIPLDPVLCFAKALQNAGIPKLRLSPAWLVNRAVDNPHNQKTREILQEFRLLNIPVSHGNDISLSGNAAKYLAEYYPITPLDLNTPCGSAPYTEPLTDVTSLSIEPNGDVTACAFVIGNLHRESMETIVSRYDPTKNEAMNALLTDGVPGLIALAKQRNLSANFDGIYSACDVCRRLAAKLNGSL